jgi:prepilin-type processing-associated H-X9-DG protein
VNILCGESGINPMSENPYTSTGYSGDTPKHKKGPRVWVTVLTVFGIGVLLVGLLLPNVRSARPAAYRIACAGNLKQIVVALLKYESVYHALPPAYTVDANGKPLHSWRTLILPYLEERKLYESIDLSKPWDDQANAKACNTPVGYFHCPADSCPPNHTTYLASVAPNGCFRLTEPRRLSEITADVGQTLMVIEVPSDRSVPWMSPNDADEPLIISIGPESKLAHSAGINAAMCDGSVHFLQADMPAADRRAMISIAGHNKIGADK